MRRARRDSVYVGEAVSESVTVSGRLAPSTVGCPASRSHVPGLRKGCAPALSGIIGITPLHGVEQVVRVSVLHA